MFNATHLASHYFHRENLKNTTIITVHLYSNKPKVRILGDKLTFRVVFVLNQLSAISASQQQCLNKPRDAIKEFESLDIIKFHDIFTVQLIVQCRTSIDFNQGISDNGKIWTPTCSDERTGQHVCKLVICIKQSKHFLPTGENYFNCFGTLYSDADKQNLKTTKNPTKLKIDANHRTPLLAGGKGDSPKMARVPEGENFKEC